MTGRINIIINRYKKWFIAGTPINLNPLIPCKPVSRLAICSSLMLFLSLFSPYIASNPHAATITVNVAGTGTGTVSSSQGGISCPGSCSATIANGTPVTFSAFANDSTTFSGWGGVCAGREICSFTVNGDATVTAQFSAKSSPVHVGGSFYGALQKGCDDVAAGGTVMAVAQDQPGDLTLERGINFTLKGGYDSGFSGNSGITEVGGKVSLATGSMTVENIAIGPAPSSTPTAAPTNLVATPGNGQVSLTWSSVPTATSYRVYYSTSTGVTRATGTLAPDTSSPALTVTGLSNGTTYYFVVTAVSSGGESVESNQVITAPVLPAPAAPTNVQAISGNGQATISWNAVSGATSYNIYYSTSSTVSKTSGTKITNATNPRIVTGLSNNTPYWFVVTAVNSGGESAESSPAVFAVPTAPATGFGQSDLTGTWYFIRFAAGPSVTGGSDPAWIRGSANVASNGSVTVTSILDSLDHSTPPPAGSLTMTIDPSGVVTQSGTSALDLGNHAVMAASKKLVVGNGSDGSSRCIVVFVKQDGTTFSNSDLAGKSFAYHQLNSGDGNEWEYGSGSVNSLRQVSISSSTDPSGTATNLGIVDTISLSNTGIMTSNNSTSWGVMTPDKKNVFVTESQSENGATWYTFRVIQLTGGVTFSQSDLAGIWRTHALISSSFDPYWEYQTLFIDNSGNAYSIVDTDSYGNTDYSDGTGAASLSSTGVMTSNEPGSDFHGQLSYDNKMAVITETWGIDEYTLSIVLKQ